MGLARARSVSLCIFIDRLPSSKSSTITRTDASATTAGSGGWKLTVPYAQDLYTRWFVTLACDSP